MKSGGGWNLYTDIIQPFIIIEKFFSKEECEEIVKYGKKQILQDATVSVNNNIKKNIRDSKISWLFPNKNTEHIFRKLTDAVLEVNQNVFNFDISGFTEGLQFTNYKAPGGNYTRHVDSGYGMNIRKLSISVQLTDPKKYEGGDFLLMYDPIDKIMPKDQGTLIIFPSYVLHQICPVTKGERNSLVTWITGKNFK
jgi:PKHD-type hydroxylase